MTSEERKARRLAIAQARAEHSRSQLAATMGQIQARLHPRALMQEAAAAARAQGMKAAEEAVTRAREHPALIVAVAGAIGLLAARRPVLRAIVDLFGRSQEPAPDERGSAGWSEEEKRA